LQKCIPSRLPFVSSIRFSSFFRGTFSFHFGLVRPACFFNSSTSPIFPSFTQKKSILKTLPYQEESSETIWRSEENKVLLSLESQLLLFTEFLASLIHEAPISLSLEDLKQFLESSSSLFYQCQQLSSRPISSFCEMFGGYSANLSVAFSKSSLLQSILSLSAIALRFHRLMVQHELSNQPTTGFFLSLS